MNSTPFLNISCLRSVALAAAIMGGSIAASADQQPLTGNDKTKAEQAAMNVINDFIGDATFSVTVNVDLGKTDDGKDRFSYDYDGGLTIHASSGVAACRAFYDFAKSNNAGVYQWSGKRFVVPTDVTKASQTTFTSPYRDHQYFNVVTYGYTTPYWDEDRWDQEINWMALHGVDMPLMLVGSEAVYRKVFQNLYQLTDAEIQDWEVGPAHLPWFRMGNLSGAWFDGPLGQHWYDRQEQLAKHILERMRDLGMKPVCPAFGGFVPGALQSKVDGVEKVGWSWCKNGPAANYRLGPSSEDFVTIGTEFIKEWERTYGECKYYLSDSFNEMSVPNDLQVLTGYGDNIFRCIDEGSSCTDAVWVTQGWTFVYQAGEWGKDKFNALTANVPKGRFNMLYMSPEYGNGKWNSPYEGFNGHDWTITMLPNMGGKNFYNGGLTTYAGNWRTQYTGTNCANLTGWGMTPEGVENNEMIYEMICDAGWTPANQTLDVNNWKSQYANSRYGQYDPDIQAFYNTLQSTVLSGYQDHRSFGWQGYNKTNNYNEGRINPGKTFFDGMEAFLSKENIAKYKDDCPDLLRYDIIEAAVFYAGCRVELLNKRIKIANDSGDKEKALQLVDSLEVLMTQMDRVLTAHPIYDEAKWEAKAVKMAGGRGTVADGGQETRDKYVKNARCITSVWHGNHGTDPGSHEPVNDYACRVWAGLIRDYYMPRLAAEWRARINGESVNLRTLENTYVPLDGKAPDLSTIENDLTNADNATVFAQISKLMELAKPLGEVTFQHLTEIKPSNDIENHWYSIRSAGENFNLRVLTSTGDNPSVSKSGNLVANEFDGGVNQMWRFIDNGDGTYRIESRNGQSMAYNTATSKPVTYLTNFDTDIRMEFHSEEAKLTDATKDCWGIIPVATNNDNTGYHMNSGQGLMVWNHVKDGKYYADSSWSIEDIANNDETYVEDYTRYAKRLNGFSLWGDPTLVGGTGQPKTDGSVATALAALGNYTAGDHESYNDFLKKWNEQILTPHFNVPEAQTPARKLFDALLSVFQTVTPSTSNAAANDALKAAVAAAQRTIATGDAEACNAEIANLKEAVNAFVNASAPQKTNTISEGVYVLKNISANRNACLYEEADGKLHLKADVAGQSDAPAGYFFTLVADGGNYKIRTAKNQYIPALTQTKSAPGSAHQSSAAEGASYTFTYNTDHWTIQLASDATKYLYCFGPSYNDGRLLNAGSGDVTDGGKWELYRIPQADNTPTGPITNEWTGTDWQAAAFGTKAEAAGKTNFYGACYYDYNSDVTVTETGKVSATLTYESGSHAQGMYGIQLISKDAASNSRSLRAPSAEGALDDYNFGTVGGSPKTQTYTVNSVPAGTYTLRVWSCATKERETITANGKLEVNVNDTKVGENAWNKNSWKIDNSIIPEKVKENANMVKIGVTLDEGNGGTRNYRYLDKEMTFDKATTLTTTVTSSDKTKTMEIIGVELLKNDGTLVTTEGSYDGHYGNIGAVNANNTYTLAIPAAGTYTVRVWASYVRNEVASAGAATYDVPQNTLTLTKVEGIWVAPSLLESGAFADNTVWYSLANQQTNQTGYISTKYTNGNFLATTNTTKDTSDAGLWCVIGNAENGYKFYNKAAGASKVLSNNANTASSMVDASATANVTFVFNERTAGSAIWNIKDFGTANNYWCGSGNKLGHWDASAAASDNNCRWIFNAETADPTTPVDPEESDIFSTADEPVFWGLQFNKSHVYVSDKGLNNLAETTSNFVTGWAFIGNADSFKLLDTKGNYMGVKNAVPNDGNKAEGPFCYATNDASAETFKLLNDNGTTFEIARTSAPGKSFNPWGGQKAGINIGFWNGGSDDNKLVRVDIKDIEYFVDAKGATTYAKPSKHTLWYNEPAPTDYAGWQEYSLPIGNGEFGGSIFGGVATDKITFNEKSLWDGTSTTKGNPNHGEYLKFGSIWVTDHSAGIADGVTDYVRYLDIDNAVAGVEYTGSDHNKYTRTFIASQPAKALIGEYKAGGEAKLDLTFSVVPGGLVVERSTTKPSVSYNADGSATFSGKLALLSYAAQFTVKGDDGAVIEATDGGIRISNTSNVMLYVAGATDFDAWNNVSGQFTNGHAAQLPAEVNSTIEAAAAKDFDALRAEATAEYRQWMDRVSFDLKKDGQGVDSEKTTKDLITAYTNNTGNIRETAEGLFLEQLYYNYGRYLLISSNRYAPVPNNLQGLWVDTDSGHAPWNSDIHTNINIQMNYWPAEQNNLSELHMPLLNHIKSISQSPGCTNQAKSKNATVGWVVDTESNLFGGMSSWSDNYTIANAWYCTHLWQHYRFTKDKQFLREFFPVMWSAAQYWAERMVPSTNGDGTYECPNEYSPEHGPQRENATAHSQQLVNELFANTLEAIEILGNESTLEAEWLDKIRDRAAKSDSGLRTEEYAASSNWGTTYLNYGEPILKEWKYSSFTAGANKHRHTSHLMALYPFNQVSYFSDQTTPEGKANYDLAVAARNSLAQRSDESTGWAMGWRVNLWARTLDGNHARLLINNALRHAGSGVYYNLWDSHSPFQIDGNFGVCAGISEMLIQSYDETIHLLPALPDAWADGSISGLKAVGNFTVDQTWTEGKLTGADITSNAGGTLRVEYGKKLYTIADTHRGATYHFDVDANGDLTYNLVDASIVTITDYIDGARSGAPYDADVLKQYEDVVLKVSQK